jgi:virginiamycin B lyase
MLTFSRRLVMAAVAALVCAAFAGTSPVAASSGVVHFDLPGRHVEPYAMVNGPDGFLWFTESRGNAIGHITTSGQVSIYKLPTPHSQPRGITGGPDGNVWFTEAGTNRIGVMDLLGNLLAEYDLPTKHAVPWDIVTPSDAPVLWFTERGADQVASITIDGQIHEHALPAGSRPTGMSADLTGDAWFTETGGNAIGRIDTNVSDPFSTLQVFDVPSRHARPWDITASNDGTMWFSELAGRIAHVAQDGAMAEFSVPGRSPVWDLNSGNGGTLWFTQNKLDRVGSMSLSGDFGPFFKTRTRPLGISPSSDSGIWFCESGGNSIGRVEGGSPS